MRASWFALVMTLFMSVPRSVGPGVPGSNLLVGILYGAADGEGKAAAVRAEVVARFTYPGDPELSRPVISRAHRVSSGREVDASRGKGRNPKEDAARILKALRGTRSSRGYCGALDHESGQPCASTSL